MRRGQFYKISNVKNRGEEALKIFKIQTLFNNVDNKVILWSFLALDVTSKRSNDRTDISYKEIYLVHHQFSVRTDPKWSQ